MIETIDKQVGDDAYKITQLGTKEADRVTITLARTGGLAIAEMLRGIEAGALKGGKIDLGALQIGAVADAVASLCTKLTIEDLDFLRDVFAKKTQVRPRGESGDVWRPLAGELDFHFAGRRLAYFKWIAACIEVNFADFFGDSLASALAAFRRPEKGSSS
jgi:hypothetical protein